MEKIKVLDHGYVGLVEAWGSDERIIEAARMSTGKGFLGWGPFDMGACDVCQTKPGRCWNCSYAREEHVCHHCRGTGRTTKPGDEKLLKYLWDHRHSTPFEMAGLIVEIQAPIMVFREWHRHRTQCLAGDSVITCVTPRGTTTKRTIKELYELKYGGVADSAPLKYRNGTSRAGTPVWRAARRKDPWRIRKLPNCQNRMLRVLNESTGLFETAPMADVWESGVKPVFLVRAGDYSIRASAEHPFFTKRGWVKTRDLRLGDEIARMGKVASRERPIPPALRTGIGVWTSMMRSRLICGTSDVCYICNGVFAADELELDHVVPVALALHRALDTENLKPACKACHRSKTDLEQPSREGMARRGVRWERVRYLPSPVGEEMTYDLEVQGEHHNYCANDLVVHNSYSELSARYTPLPDVNYMPTPERCLVVNGANKQANAASGANQLTHESVLAWLQELAEVYEHEERVYQSGLRRGIPKELARLPIGVGRYSRMRASANLRNWLAFLTLRSDLVESGKAAQLEIRQFANEVGNLIKTAFPRTFALFVGE